MKTFSKRTSRLLSCCCFFFLRPSIVCLPFFSFMFASFPANNEALFFFVSLFSSFAYVYNLICLSAKWRADRSLHSVVGSHFDFEIYCACMWYAFIMNELCTRPNTLIIQMSMGFTEIKKFFYKKSIDHNKRCVSASPKTQKTCHDKNKTKKNKQEKLKFFSPFFYIFFDW